MAAEAAQPLFITNDPVKINTFFVMAREYAVASNYHLGSLKKLDAKAASLIRYFSEKYGLD